MFAEAAIYITISSVCADSKYGYEICQVQTDRRPVTQDKCIAHGKILTDNAIKSFQNAGFKGPFRQNIECQLKDKPTPVEPVQPVEPEQPWYVRIAGWFLSLIF